MPSVSPLDVTQSTLVRVARRPARPPHPGFRTVTIGLLGLGNVGQAVARLAADDRLHPRGWGFRVAAALVRDTARARQAPRPAVVTDDPSAFLRGRYDVVIEALGDITPARRLVARLLGQGVPVVTANQTLVAAHGRGLTALAALSGTTLRYEASALAGVPFLGALAARPLVADLDRCTAVVNGTSNFILSRIDADACTLDAALDAARRLGLTEPDASRDLDGADAADKVALLGLLFGWGRLPAAAIERRSIRDLTADDFRAARSIGATIKPVACATRSGGSASAFVGPALVPSLHPLATLHGTLTGIQLSGTYVADLFFSGPGAGPDVTAATLLDDAIESVSSVPGARGRANRAETPLTLTPAVTDWFVRASFPGLMPDALTVSSIFSGFGLDVRQMTEAIAGCRWLRIGHSTAERVADAETRLRDTHRIRCLSLRAL
jgi:homoserine dehydrogenase